jgi:hypothetical protein
VVFQHGLGDAQVSYLGVYNLARSAGASMFKSNVHEPAFVQYGIPALADTATGQGCMVQTWQFPGVQPAFPFNIPPNTSTDTHEGPRRQYNGQEMMYTFFTTGDIVNTCNGPCMAPRCCNATAAPSLLEFA